MYKLLALRPHTPTRQAGLTPTRLSLSLSSLARARERVEHRAAAYSQGLRCVVCRLCLPRWCVTCQNGEWGCSTRGHMLRVLRDRVLCLPTFSHWLIVNKLLSLSLSLSLSLPYTQHKRDGVPPRNGTTAVAMGLGHLWKWGIGTDARRPKDTVSFVNSVPGYPGRRPARALDDMPARSRPHLRLWGPSATAEARPFL